MSVDDPANASLSASQTVAISGGPAVALEMTTDLIGPFEGSPVTTAGQTFKVILTAIDAYGNTATGYTGDVVLSANVFPFGFGIWHFGAGDSGSKTIRG